MLIKTKDFDYVEISQNDAILFPQGIYGYEDTKKFVLLNNPDNELLKHLQSVDDENPRLLLIDPYLFIDDYKPVLPEGSLELLKAKNTDDICFFVVAVIPDNIKDMTVNLKSPVVINFKEKTGAQIILENRDYSTRTRLFDQEGTDR